MDIQAVIMDMDGLMLDTEPLYKAAWQAAAAELRCELDDRLYARFVGLPTAECERILLEHVGVTFPLDPFRVRWPELWNAMAARDGIRQKPGLLAFLQWLEERKLPLAIATSSNRAYTEFSLRHGGLEDRIEVMVTGDQVTQGKPAPDIYLEAARRLGVEPARCLALEDSEVGIVAARRAGMVTLLIPDGGAPSREAVHAAWCVLGSLNEAPALVASILAGPNPAGSLTVPEP